MTLLLVVVTKGKLEHRDLSVKKGIRGPRGLLVVVILQTIKNLHAPTSNNDAFNKAFCETTYRKKSDDNQLVILGSGNRWEADDKTIYDLIRTQYDDEAVASRQRKDFSDKKYVDSKPFTIDASKGLDMKGNKVIHVADPTSATDGGKKRYIDTKTSNHLKTDGTRVMTGNLNMNSRSRINVKKAQTQEKTCC